MKKTIFIFTITILLLFGAWQSCHAVDLLLDWPSIGGQQSLNELNKSGNLDFPNLISYIYKFALGICGIVALISIIFGAVQYVLSAGDASKAGDAKDRITQALLGILILLGAVLILQIINPDLIKLTLSPVETAPQDNISTDPSEKMIIKDYQCFCNGEKVWCSIELNWYKATVACKRTCEVTNKSNPSIKSSPCK